MSIVRHYGLTPGKMDRTLARFTQILKAFDCGATFPVTAWTLSRSRGVLARYQAQGIEFAVHGYYHVDYSQLSLDQQLDHLRQARQAFEQHQLVCKGFRCPYLRWNPETLAALRELGFGYDSSQALFWDVTDGVETEAYQRALTFYGARPAKDYPALPRLEGDLVCIPYSVPDDEALVERLRLDGGEGGAPKSALWLEILQRTYTTGELFTVGLHPERIDPCAEPLRAVLKQARALIPRVWIARLDEIADWWRRRAATHYQVTSEAPGVFRLTVDGPPGTTVLARAVTVQAPSAAWARGYQRVSAQNFTFQADKRPVIGLAPDSPAALVSFLKQQGYLVAHGADPEACAYYVARERFAKEDERLLLAQLEAGTWPLLRLGRWPDGAQSALAVTGDIDALTLWDYGLRMFNS